MPARPRGSGRETYELLRRDSEDSQRSYDDERDRGITGYTSSKSSPRSWRPVSLLSRLWPAFVLGNRIPHRASSRARRLPLLLRIVFRYISIAILFLTFLAYFVYPSYTHPPEHYEELRKQCQNSDKHGRGNIAKEKIFIAASIYDKKGELLNGAWGKAMLDLVDILGPENVYLSIYENDADEEAQQALKNFRGLVQSKHTILTEHLPLSDIHTVKLPDGDRRVKRIAFLAEVRNRALRPLETESIKYDKVLFVNDVMFDPIDIAQLLFSTARDPRNGKTTYGAACAVDFINAFKFYDRFATRDLDGYSMGIPFYPWFTSAGSSTSRRDVLSQSDAVRVRSCWGGITAFDATWFQKQELQAHGAYPAALSSTALDYPPSEVLPLRFRFEKGPFWDASECCLIHADLTYARHGLNLSNPLLPGLAIDSGIVMNPYVRVAYDSSSLSWLPYTRRPEKMYAWIHDMLNRLVGLPAPNLHQHEQPGDKVTERRLEAESGGYKDVERLVEPGRFCGGRKLLVMKENTEDGKNWERLPIPDDEPW